MAKKTSKKKLKARRRAARRAFITFLILFALAAAFVRFVVFVPVYMPTNAMAPTYKKGDLVYADKLTMWKDFRVNRGDLIYAVFEANDGGYIRRVMGMPGDLIDVRDGIRVLVTYENGAVTNEIVLADAPALVYGEIPNGAYLLLADNLDEPNVADSRTLGLIKDTAISAAPGAILWPPSRAFRSVR